MGADGFATGSATMRDTAGTLRGAAAQVEGVPAAPGSVDAGAATPLVTAVLGALAGAAGELSVRVSAAADAVDRAQVVYQQVDEDSGRSLRTDRGSARAD